MDTNNILIDHLSFIDKLLNIVAPANEDREIIDPAIEEFEHYIAKPENKLLNDLYWEYCNFDPHAAGEFLWFTYFPDDLKGLRNFVSRKSEI